MIKVHAHFDPILLGEVKLGVLFGIVLQIVTAHLLANGDLAYLLSTGRVTP